MDSSNQELESQMSVAIFHKVSKLLVKTSREIAKSRYETVGAAKAALTRADRAGRLIAAEYSIADTELYLSSIKPTPKMVTVINLMTGLPIEIAEDTPRCCDPSTELYWSM
jgi:hypothetical protein